MATIAVDAFLDGGVARTAGEAWTIDSGAKLTIRTDSRWHANSPPSMTGSLGSITVNEGEEFIDASSVRWMPYNSGSGNVPAIGTTVSRAGASGYLLGVWASLTSAPTAVGAAMPALGFLKFREVTGGPFSAGALTGIGASATGPDVTGWLEVVHDDAANITVPRLGQFKSRGGWFYLNDTTGVRGQILQVPTNGGGADTYAPGCEIETAPGSGVYDKYPSVLATQPGWTPANKGCAEGETDYRQKFVAALTNGQMMIGDSSSVSTATYASVAAQASTYAPWTASGTYTWADGEIEVYISAEHNLYGGESVYLDFTSGDGVNQTVVATPVDAYRFVATVPGSGAGGSVTAVIGVKVTFTAHGVNEGDQVYLNVSTGTLPTGTYDVHSIEATNVYRIANPVLVTGGNASALHTIVVTRSAHGLSNGTTVTLDFTSGTAPDGNYLIRSVAANTYNVNCAHSAATSGNVTEKWHLGFVPPAGCKVRVPNIFMRSCATGSRATNSIPNTTVTNRPEFITTAGGSMDMEYLYGHWRTDFTNAYLVRVHNCVFTDYFSLSNVVAPLDIDGFIVGGHGWSGNNSPALAVVSCVSGGTIKNGKAFRHGSGNSYYHGFRLISCADVVVDAVEWGHHVNSSSGTEWGLTCSYSSGIMFRNTRSNHGEIRLQSCSDVKVENHEHNARMIGVAALNGYSGVIVEAGSRKITVDGVSVGPGGGNSTTLLYCRQSTDVTFRNIGTFDEPIILGSALPNAWASQYFYQSGGNNVNIRLQRCNYGTIRATTPLPTQATDDGLIVETVLCKDYTSRLGGRLTLQNYSWNADYKGVGAVQNTVTLASVYGHHMSSLFNGTRYGEIVLAMQEPTTDTASLVQITAGNVRFNASTGVMMNVVGDQAIWEMPFFAKGHTGFSGDDPVQTGGNAAHYTREYQIDTGSGYGAWTTLTGANLAAETISPATGFRLRIRITTIAANTAAINFLRIPTRTTWAAQTTNLYPLDVSTLTLTGLPTGTEIHAYLGANPETAIEIAGVEASGATFSFTHTAGGSAGFITFVKRGLKFFKLPITYQTSDVSIPIFLDHDLGYNNPA